MQQACATHKHTNVCGEHQETPESSGDSPPSFSRAAAAAALLAPRLVLSRYLLAANACAVAIAPLAIVRSF